VPNALMFIDKYTQVPRILNPVALCVSQVDEICKDPGLKAYVDSQFGGADQCRKAILSDFFRHAFDGGKCFPPGCPSAGCPHRVRATCLKRGHCFLRGTP
jgi:hypothetical protein